MKNAKEIFVEITSTANIPSTPTALPKDVVTAWNNSLDYDYKMKRKFSYYDVVFKTKTVGKGFKGHLTKTQNKLKNIIDFHKLDPNKTIKELYSLYPPKHF